MPDIHDYQRGDVFIIGIGGSSTSGLALQIWGMWRWLFQVPSMRKTQLQPWHVPII